MQYVILIYQGTTPLPNTPEWETLSKEQQQAVYHDYAALNSNPKVTQGLPLGLPEKAKTVRVDNGVALATDGPFIDAKGAVGGYVVLEADDMEAAVELAATIPAARHGGAVEVRAAETYW